MGAQRKGKRQGAQVATHELPMRHKENLSCECIAAVERVFGEAGEVPQLEVFRMCLGQVLSNPV